MANTEPTRFFNQLADPSSLPAPLLQVMLDTLSDHIALIDASGTILFVNAAWRRFGAANGALNSDDVGRNYLSICDQACGEDAPLAQSVAHDLRAVLSGERESFSRIYRCDSEQQQRWFTMHSVRLSYSAAPYVVLYHRDITDQMTAQRSLKSSQERYHKVWESSNDALALSDPNGIMLDANPAYYQIYGGTPAEVIGASFARIFPPEQRDWAEKSYRETFHKQPAGIFFESQVIGADSRQRTVESRIDFIEQEGQRIGMLSIVRDITERRIAEAQRMRIEQQIHESQRLESIGLLAGGIAHDFNNMLTSVRGHTELSLTEMPPNTLARRDLEQAMTGIQHMADLTQQLLAYAGKGSQAMRPVFLNSVIQEMEDLLQISATKALRLHVHLAPDLPPLSADISQLRQIILNLITNAAEAMRGRPGSIKIITQVEQLTQDVLADWLLGATLPSGPYVVLTVSDMGAGMDAATLARIFEPFFTTKAFGHGLGLASVQGIVRRHQGAIKVLSAANTGTTFMICFPTISPSTSQLAPPLEQPIVQPGPGTVLLIDDEESVRSIACRMLQRMGYSVIAAENGSAGLAALHSGNEQPSVVLLDLTMPQMGGEVVAKALKAEWPDLPIILMSGYSTLDLAEVISELKIEGMLQKPFSLAMLRAALVQAQSSGKDGYDG